MLTLYAGPTSNGIRATIMVEEIGLPCDLRRVNLAQGENRSPEYLALNPTGQIPVLVDPDGPGGGVKMDQSGAILLYLAEKTGKFLPMEAAARARFLPAYASILSDGSMTLGAVFSIMRMPEPHEPTRALFAGRLAGYMKQYDGWLGQHACIAGDEPTIADFALYPMVYRMAQVTPDLLAGLPNVDRWSAEMAARPGVQRGIAAVA